MIAWSLYHIAFIAAGISLLWSLRRKARVPYPPGPPAEPIIGHMRVMPSANQEIVFREWSRTYGEIMYFRVPGRSYLVLNSLKAANELLEKRSGIYSDRMRMILFEIMGWVPGVVTFLPYGKRFQKHRRLMQEYLHQKKCVSYEPLQTQHARRLLIHLMDNPKNWEKHFQRLSTAIIVKIAYGRDISDEDPYLDIATRALTSFTSCGSPGSTPIDLVPLCTYYAHKARGFCSAIREMHDYPFDVVKCQLADGTAQPSYLSHYLEQLHGNYLDQEHMYDLKGSAVTLFAGGAETTQSALSFFLLAMVLFPECQKKAQKEIDEIIGNERLPETTDRKALPYVEALMQEVLRWNTVVPSGIPHRSTEDDVYNGMFIPKGTVVIANNYAILRDETIYSNPDSFDPSRYLQKPEGKAEPYPVGQFGFGRRGCPGRYLGEAGVFIAISSILATLDIGRSLDNEGNEIIPEVDLVTGVASHPKHFPCSIKPRDKQSEGLVRQAQLWSEV